MDRCRYTMEEVRAARRLLEDLELGRWPRRELRVVAVDEVGTVAAAYAVGEVLRAVEQRMRAGEIEVCPPASAIRAGVEESAA